MFKKTLAVAALICTIPAIASASWFLTTQAKNAGGTLASDNGTQVVTNGAITHSYAAQTLPITATPATGNTLRSLVVTAKGLNALQNYTTVVSNVASGYTIPSPQNGWSYNVAATFQANSLTVVAGNSGGSVTPSKLGNVFYGYKLVNPLTFTFAPMAGYTITGISGAPAEATVVVPNVANKAATVTFPVGYTFTTSLDMEATAVNNTPSMNRVLPQTVTIGATVNLAASANNIPGATYSWAYVSGPANTTSVNGTNLTSVAGPAIANFPATGAAVSFTAPSTAGQYKFVVTEGTTGKTTLATVNVVAQAADVANQCQFCHTANGIASSTIGASWAKSVHADKQCADCHVGAQSGSHPGAMPSCSNCHSAEAAFYSSPHWVNNVYTPEPEFFDYTDTGAWVGYDSALPKTYASQISDIQVPLEAQGLGSCMNKCHFRPDQGGIKAPWSFPLTKTGCMACHSTGGAFGDNSGGALSATNLATNKGGPGLSGTMPDGTVITLAVPGAWTNVPGSVSTSFKNMSSLSDNHDVRKANMYTTCLVCHFGKNHGNPTYSYLKSEHYANPYWQYGDKQVQCQDCHDPHTTKAAFPQYALKMLTNSNTVAYAKTADGACDKCHSGQYGIFNADADKTIKAPHATGTLANGGAAVNVGSTTPGWYTGTRNVFINATSQYVTPRTTCYDCHGHNNSVNGEYKLTMHADPYGRTKSADYFKFRGYSSAVATQYTPDKVSTDGCVRCHTTTGFVNFVESGYKDLRAWGFQNSADTTGEVISCRACHRTTAFGEDHPDQDAPDAFTQPGEGATGALPEGTYNWKNPYTFTKATPEGVRNPVAIRAYNQPYTGYYNYSVAKLQKFVTAVPFADYKNSNLCVPCHAGRNGATNGTAIKTLGGFTNFTTLTVLGNKTPGLPHGVYQSAVLNGSIGYQYSAYTPATNSHALIGTSTTSSVPGIKFNGVNTPGPCVSCHMDFKTVTGKPDGVNTVTTQHRKHSFAIRGTSVYTALCSKCHSAGFGDSGLDTAKTNFQAAVAALAEIMKSSNNKYGTAIVTGVSQNAYGALSWTLADSKRVIPGVSFSGNNQGFADLVGAYYNLNLLWNAAYGTSDLGAYAHNPQYLKQLLGDTINALRAPSTASVSDAISQLPTNDPVNGLFPGFSSLTQGDANIYLSTNVAP